MCNNDNSLSYKGKYPYLYTGYPGYLCLKSNNFNLIIEINGIKYIIKPMEKVKEDFYLKNIK